MDSAFHYEGADFLAEGVKLAELAEQCGTPLYVYSRAALTENYRALERALAHCAHLICYSVKAASNTAILRLLKDEGSGADIVSEGELLRCLKAGMDPKKIVFSGVGKKVSEMKAALEAGILMFNVESAGEMELLNRAAGEKGVRAPMAFRVNPDVDPQTHPYIATGLRESKFGVPVSEAPELYKTAAGLANLEVIGADCHIGSQLTKVSPFEAAAERMENLLGELAGLGIALKYLDMGGGLGIRYRDEEVPRAEDYGAAVSKIAGRFRDLTLIIEPGRSVSGNAAVLVVQVLYNKKTPWRHFIVADGAMNDLLRPSLYGAHHEIREVTRCGRPAEKVSLVGPVCESGDFLARDREMPLALPGEYLAVLSAGAYGFSMSSSYNSRPRAAEVLADGQSFRIIRTRETPADLLRGESL